MYEFNLTQDTRKQINDLFAKYIDPDDTEINIDEIEINETFIAIMVNSGVLAVKYTIENGQVVAKMSPTFEGNIAVKNLTNTFITNGLQKFVVERMNLNGGKRSSKRSTKRGTKRSSKRSKRRTRKA
uniref:Uncharacterized protein n=1 Tax=viral metagenome TaxID=1070528 RepID=A0A6C0KNH3_9ZZZZ